MTRPPVLLASVPFLCAIVLAAATGAAHAQARLAPPATSPPSLADVRRDMGIPSQGTMRGQLDAVGFASRPEQMARVWEMSTTPPAPEKLGEAPAPGVAAVIAPHDDYLYAARVYRQILPLVTAKTVVLVGVFHKYRRFAQHDRLVFDTYATWRTPDGPVPVSPLRDELTAALAPDEFIADAAMHDAEHSLEALVYWLHHVRPDLEIVPVIVPAAGFERLQHLSQKLGAALAAAVRRRGWTWGRDVALAISSDAVHYGPDFDHVPFGAGGIDAYARAVANDTSLIRTRFAGPLTVDNVRAAYATYVDPAAPDHYRLTWCGRFAVPFGLLLLRDTAAALGLGVPSGHPVAYATSVGWPEIPVHDLGLGATAPDSLFHFVGYPAVAFTCDR